MLSTIAIYDTRIGAFDAVYRAYVSRLADTITREPGVIFADDAPMPSGHFAAVSDAPSAPLCYHFASLILGG